MIYTIKGFLFGFLFIIFALIRCGIDCHSSHLFHIICLAPIILAIAGCYIGKKDRKMKKLVAEQDSKIERLVKENEEATTGKTINAMIATYNHEIRNPLCIAIGHFDLLRDIPDEKRKIIKDALIRINTILKEIEKLQEDPKFREYASGLILSLEKIDKDNKL